MWAALYGFLLSFNPGTLEYEVSGWIIRNIVDPINEVVYALNLTEVKPISKLEVSDFLN